MAKPMKKYSNLTITEKNFLKRNLGIESIADIDTMVLKRLKEELKKLKDTRAQGKIIYKLWDIIVCAIIAVFANCNE